MAQACDKYTKQSLMGNWYEERLAPVQHQRDPEASRKVRGVEESISIPGDNGNILPLPRIPRHPAWITQDIVPDDGFREFRSLQSTAYDPKNIHNLFGLKDCRQIIKTNGQRVMYPECNPSIAQTGGVQNYNMLQTQNLNQVEYTRDVHQNITDFGSTFKAHPEAHNQFFGVTTYSSSFQNPKGLNVKDILAENEKKQTNHPGGAKEREDQNQSMKMTSVLTGEKFRNLGVVPDPKDNTSIQRSWLPAPDPAIVQAQKNILLNTNLIMSQSKPFDPLQTYKRNTQQALPYDIATSLPLSDGTYALQRQYNNPGEYRHIRTDVTIIKNKPLTKK